MQRFASFTVLIILVCIWCFFFAAFKFFFWSALPPDFHISLEHIAANLSIGSVFAYVIGAAVLRTFSRRWSILVTTILTAVVMTGVYFWGMHSPFVFGIFTVLIGFLYSMWSVVKNVLAAVEIEHTGLSDTIVVGILNVAFVVSLIAGSILGAKVFEWTGIAGIAVFFGLVAIASLLSPWVVDDPVTPLPPPTSWGAYRREKFAIAKSALREYFPSVLFILRHYGIIIVTICILWGVSTVASQKAIEFSVFELHKTKGQASILLLYSSIGAILGNIVSIFFRHYRWQSYYVFSGVFGILVCLFPLAFDTTRMLGQFGILIGLAVFIGTIFGLASNLIEGFFFKRMLDENQKEYGSAVFGLSIGFIMWIIMTFSDIATRHGGSQIVFFVLGPVILLSTVIIALERRRIHRLGHTHD